MKKALVNGIKQEATKGAKGQCLCCGADVIAKCGKIRRWHWAHKNNEECSYSKKEFKTQWHLDWQYHFHKDWQEVRCTDEQTGEVHIADIKTPSGLVVEFQHSAITPEERSSREQFHKNMIWVVDGTRLKNDFKNFFANFRIWKQIQEQTQNRQYSVYKGFIHNRIPMRWLKSTTTVYFDFHNNVDNTASQQEKDFRNLMWGFFKIDGEHFVVSISRDCFVDYVQREVIRNIEQVTIPAFQQKTLQPAAITASPVLRSSQMVYRRSNSYSGMNAKQINRIKSKNPGFGF